MLILLMTILMMSIYIMLMKHPITMGSTLLIQTISISLMLGFFNSNYWYSYILFLIMISGMLVLFLYMTSVASNELFYPSMKILYLTMFIMIMYLMIMNIDMFYFNINNIYIPSLNLNISFNKYFNYPNNMIMYLLILYLLFALLVVVKITNFKKGALRPSFKK
uniref:NADH-ubiquinone oxidoreductase chain 6 n=1 Tax=Eurysternus sp. KM-2017 TaxID=2219492 RepID=A0A346RGW0_9SCAR|nr:NADH dehydrogenase subunit 6 [Eurysternus sp. KM-2017]